MTDFGDDLRALLAKKKEQFFVREMQEERQRQALTKLRDDTRRAAARLAREVFLPLLEEFREVMEAAGVLCGGRVEEGRTGRHLCRLRALGAAPGSPHYEIRVSCVPDADGRIEAAVECVDATAAEFAADDTDGGEAAWTALFAAHPVSPSPPPSDSPLPASGPVPLLTLPKKTFRAAAIDADAARQWCAGLLKRCGQACMDANRKQA